MATNLSEVKKLQLEFWTAFSLQLERSSFDARKAAPKNWYYLPSGSGRATIVLTASFADGVIGCKLAGRPAEVGEKIIEALSKDRKAIEVELGFSELDWGNPTGTRIYRFRHANLKEREGWREAFTWLIASAERFKEVFAPRLSQIDLGEPDEVDGRGSPGSRHDKHRHDAMPVANPRMALEQTGAGAQPDPRRRALRAGPRSDPFRQLAEECRLVIREREMPGGHSMALYSPESEPTYRYAFALWWGEPTVERTAAWVLLNPSTGDTDRRPRPVLAYCRNRSRGWGFDGLVIVNLFAYRTRDPTRLTKEGAIGPANDRALEVITAGCPLTVAAWGNHGGNWNRSTEVRGVLRDPHCLRKNGMDTSLKGEPFHPRGLASDAELIRLPDRSTVRDAGSSPSRRGR